MNMKTLTETSTFRVLSLLLCFCFFIPAMNVSASSLQADKFKVSGIVKDATGEPVIGASVVEKGTTNGTVTDLDGNFNLSVASNSTIVISFIGYSDQEFHISKDNSDVTALVNEVRQRADVNMPTVEEVEGTSLSKDELLEVIKHERRVELAFEGLRLFDLYRWKELDKAVANIENERTMYGLAYEARKFNGERDYVWPLPTAELDTNKKLVQHDLWK